MERIRRETETQGRIFEGKQIETMCQIDWRAHTSARENQAEIKSEQLKTSKLFCILFSGLL